jgi:hypothetical protein
MTLNLPTFMDYASGRTVQLVNPILSNCNCVTCLKYHCAYNSGLKGNYVTCFEYHCPTSGQ